MALHGDPVSDAISQSASYTALRRAFLQSGDPALNTLPIPWRYGPFYSAEFLSTPLQYKDGLPTSEGCFAGARIARKPLLPSDEH